MSATVLSVVAVLGYEVFRAVVCVVQLRRLDLDSDWTPVVKTCLFCGSACAACRF